MKKVQQFLRWSPQHVPWERICVGISTLFVWGLLSYFLFFLHIRNQVGDTAFVAQVLYNFKHTLRMQTTYYTSTTESIDHVWYKPAAEVCAMDLESQFKDTPWGHHYFIAYLLVPFARVMDIPLLIAIIQAGIYTSVLLFAYLLARQKEIRIPIAVLFTLLITQHPLWDQGLVGQLYFNRFFLPLSGLIILFLERKKINYICVFLASLFAASTNEIYGITIFMIIVSYLWIYKKKDAKLLALAVGSLMFGFVSTVYIQQNFPLRSTQTNSLGSLFGHGIGGMIREIWKNIIEIKTRIFILINILGGGFFTLFHFWLIPPLILVLVPNILVNIGGAEKIGWSTHYHIGYFIPLIWLSALGLTKIYERPKYQVIFLSICIAFLVWINPSTFQLNERPNIVIKKIAQSVFYYWQHGQRDLEYHRQLRETVKENETLSVPEAVSYHFYDHAMYYYPMGINTVSTVILRYDDTQLGDRRFSSINYGHQDPNLDLCIFNRMKKDGFDFNNPTIIDGWAIIRRQKVQ